MSESTMPVAITGWKPMVRNSLRGFATIRLGKALTIRDVAVHAANGKRWAQLPSKPMVGPDGVAKKNADGKIQYTPILEWSDRDTSDRFSEAVTTALTVSHPDAF